MLASLCFILCLQAERLGERCDLLLSETKDTRSCSDQARYAHLSPCLSVVRTSLDLDITMQSGKEFLFRSAERLGERCDLLLSGFKDTRLVSSLARFAHLSPCLSVIRTSLDLDFTVQSMKWEYASDTMYRRRCRISSRSISSMFPPVVWETETRW